MGDALQVWIAQAMIFNQFIPEEPDCRCSLLDMGSISTTKRSLEIFDALQVWIAQAMIFTEFISEESDFRCSLLDMGSTSTTKRSLRCFLSRGMPHVPVPILFYVSRWPRSIKV